MDENAKQELSRADDTLYFGYSTFVVTYYQAHVFHFSKAKAQFFQMQNTPLICHLTL